MFRPLVSLCLFVLVCTVTTAAPAQVSSTVTTRESLPNDIDIELLGKCLLYSFDYQRMINKYVGLNAGLSALGGGTSDDNTSIVFVPVGAKLYLIPKDGSVFLAGGIVVVTASVDSGPFDDNSSDTYSYLGLGMEYRSKSGLLFRGTAYGLIAGGGFFIWPGLTVGYAF